MAKLRFIFFIMGVAVVGIMDEFLSFKELILENEASQFLVKFSKCCHSANHYF